MPIRTVLFSQLTKFDGRRQRVLRSRETKKAPARGAAKANRPVPTAGDKN